jgi:hypothetical protein
MPPERHLYGGEEMANLTSRTLASRLARMTAVGLVVGGFAACDDGEDNGTTDTGGAGGMSTDMLPTTDFGRDAMLDMTPVVDLGPDAGDMGEVVPDEGVPECETDEQCAVDTLCAVGRCAEGTCVVDAIEGCCTDDAGCGAEGQCLVDLLICAEAAEPGAVIITELMVEPEERDDDVGEWIELHNPGATPVVLNGWTLAGAEGEAHQISQAELVVLEPGAWFVAARAADAVAPVAVSYLYNDFDLDNVGDRVALFDAFGTLVDEVAYGEGWPLEAGRSMSLSGASLDAAANDAPDAWCGGEPNWGGTDRGTPGAENPECLGGPEAVDWCRLQWPLDVDTVAGTPLTFYGRVHEAGLTDRSDATDADPRLLAQLGYGPDASEPAENAEWQWFDAAPNPGWSGQAEGEPLNDEYLLATPAPAEGTYDHAFRFSADAGQTWTYCDRRTDAGDGSVDGYQVDAAGSMITVAGPCEPNPCNAAPEGTCVVNVATRYAAEGVCSIDGEGFACEYPAAEEIDCAALGQVCAAGVCVDAEPLPAAGELVITELLYDPNDALVDDTAEWFEVYNTTDTALRLDGCTLVDATAGNAEIIERLVIDAGAYALFARSADPALNGGLDPDYVFGFGLNNGGDTLTISCGDVTVDQVIYDDAAPFPVNARRASIALDPEHNDAVGNDDGANWCFGEAAYFVADDPAFNHLGTPGMANPPCPVPDVTIDWCRLQFPTDVEVGAATQLTVIGQVRELGITDRTAQTDLDDGIVAQAGYGPDASDPAAADAMWTWMDAEANPAWMDAEAPGTDEYLMTFAVPAPGAYDFAWRFSRDAGLTWLYCDRNAGDGADGSEDGYLAANAGQLTSLPSPCEVETCEAPPAPVCADDGVTRVTSSGPGACEVVADAAVCTYIEQTEDCSLTGGTCEAGACVGGAPLPLAGEVRFNEFMADPHGVLADADAEWFELVNVSDHAVTLNGCIVADNFADNGEVVGPIVIEAGAIALFARNNEPMINGGLPAPAGLFGFGLNNGGDELNLTCADVLVDHVDYAAADFPNVEQRTALQRTGDRWCAANDIYFNEGVEAHRGSPGLANPACPGVAFCNVQWPPNIEGAAGLETMVFGQVHVPGITDATAGIDADDRLWAQLGYGPDGSDPMGDAWSWQRADANPGWNGDDRGTPERDEYQSNLVNPAAPGFYDYAYRFSADGGTTWTLCDLDGSDNGYAADQAGALTVQAEGDPCDPNPCDAPPAAVCEGNTVVSYVALGACENLNGAPSCTYAEDARMDCGPDDLCAGGVCRPANARAPIAGDIIFSEVLYDPHGAVLTENDSEWIELHNTTDEPLALDGCGVSKGADRAALDGLIIDAGAWVVLTKGGADVNGGIVPFANFGFALTNGGTTIALSCGPVDAAVEIDALTYDDAAPWPRDAQRHSISLDAGMLTAADNDQGENWCYGRAIYWRNDVDSTDDHRGTPGMANPPCDEPVDFCRLQSPVIINEAPGTLVDVYGRIYEEGTTDRTALTNPRQHIIGQLGWGPDASDPMGNDAWNWIFSQPNAAWESPADNDEDEYQAQLMVPGIGAFDFAWRFSADGGRTWTYCDSDAGSADGYQPENAGALTVVGGNVCEPNPCDAPPANDCADDTTRRTFPALGVCAELEGPVADCTYEPVVEACADGEICLDGACRIAGARAPAAGEIIFTEALYDPHGDVLTENDAEWVELHNTTGEPLALDGCALTKGASRDALDGLVIPADAWVVLGNGPAEVNGGIELFAEITIALTNGGTTLALTCGPVDAAVDIDVLTYDDAAPWPRDAQRHSISLDPAMLTAADNDNGSNWCYGRPVYWTNDALPLDDHRGTPGVANPPCDEPVDFCRLQSPVELEGVTGAEVALYARLYEAGTTDRHPGNDLRQHMMVEFGWGADGVDPAEWIWSRAFGNDAWDAAAAGVPNEDEYQATWMLPGVGLYSYGFRASADGGRTWTLCDGDAEGNTDGFDEPGVALIDAPLNVCDPNPCDQPPAADCADATTARTYAAIGTCAVEADSPVCTYEPTLEACLDGAVCDAGQCVVQGPPAPAAGEIIFTEVMYDPHGDLGDAEAEWFELHNTTDAELSLADCTVTANGNGGAIGDIVVPANGWVFFAKSADPALNGGLVPAGTFGFALGNGGSTLLLSCAGADVDTVAYDDVAPWPRDAQAHSISLDAGTLTAAGNDDGANWCFGRGLFYSAELPTNDNRGTPGMANPACDEPVDFCRLQSPIEIDATQGDVVQIYGRLYEEGTTDRSAQNDVRQYVEAQFGWGADGVDPADWTWTRAVANPDWDSVAAGLEAEDEYVADWALPGEGLYSFGYRFSVDGGRTWTLCDGDAEGNTDGFDEPGLALTAAADLCLDVVCDQVPADICLDDATARIFAGPGVCVVGDAGAACTYDSVDVPCDANQACEAGACVDRGPRAPAVGEVIFTEVTYDPHGVLLDDTAEWFELHNTTNEPLTLTGCRISSSSGAMQITPLTIPGDGWLVFARTDDAALNGTLDPDMLFNFALGNSSSTLTLTCGGEDVDVLMYDDGAPWPIDARRNSISLDANTLTSDGNDLGANWCYGRAVYYDNPAGVVDDHHGTPGAPNPVCDEPLDFCRLQAPAEIDGTVGDTVRIDARLYEAGVSDQWGGVDNYQFMKVEFGYGPDGSAPEAWSWRRAAGDLNWNGPANGVPDEDQYFTELVLPAEGLYEYGFKASADGGRTWTLCDAGAEGSTDGFNNPGVMLTRPPASCEPNPCDQPPAIDCADANTTRSYADLGVCELVNGDTSCTYAPVLTACGDNERCDAGACVGPPAPAAGEVIFTELMYDPTLDDATAEWLELHNTTAGPLDLEGCAFTANGNGDTFGALVIPAGGYALIGRSADPALNGGLVPDAVLTFALGNGGSTLVLDCNGEIDRVVYDDNTGAWPLDARGHSISLDRAATDAAANDTDTNWCYGRPVYFAAPLPADDHRGTPGVANPPCDEPVDFCRLQAPIEIDGVLGDEVPVFGRLFEAGTTDRHPGVDARQHVMAEFGWGADGVDPMAWTWAPAAPNAMWDGDAMGVPAEDEYQATWTLPVEGLYAYGYRFSVDGGRTWTLCDGDAEGSTDGFDEPGLALTVNPADPCEAVVCDQPPADECVDANTARIFAPVGVCALGANGPECSYEMLDVACEIAQVCEAGACVVAGPDGPAAGNIIFTEIMYDPILDDATAEWFELHNTTDAPLDLEGCRFTANGNGGNFGALVIPGGGYALVGKSVDPALNGGLVPDAVLNFALGNGGSTLILDCNGEIDRVQYDDNTGAWPRDARGHSIALDLLSSDAAANDTDANWCYGRRVYFAAALPADDHRGTPGVANPLCDEPVDFCRLQHPLEIDATQGDVVTTYGRLFEAGTTDRHPGVDVRQHVMAEFGWGADGTDPADWAWTRASANPDWDGDAAGVPAEDEYQYDWTLPAEGIYAYGYRFSVDGGRTWALCDGDAAGNTDGFANPGLALTAAPADPCALVVCDQPPANECGDDVTQAVYLAEGVCNVVNGAPECSYDFEFVACPDGSTCNAGLCEFPPAPAPEVGQIAFTEVMYDTNLDENLTEWFEVHNLTNNEMDLNGCVVNDAGGTNTLALDGLRMPAAGYLLFARNIDPLRNGGLDNVARAFGFALNNGGDTLTLTCAAGDIDTLTYDDNAAGWPDARGASTQLDAMTIDELDTNNGERWCTSSMRYLDGDSPHMGTPGAANHNCEVDFCRLQWDPAVRTSWGATTPYFVQFYRFGVTDQAQAAPADWAVEFGFGPDGVAPDAVDGGWLWQPSALNADWNLAENNDEWTSDFVAPEVIGQFDTAFRISTDGGNRWVHCDAGDAGNTDGFATPGDLIIAPPAFSADEVQARLNQDCAGCHIGGGASGGLTLDVFQETTINVQANGSPVPMMRIAPGSPETSYLFLKLSNTHRLVGGGGNSMPPGNMWSDEDLGRMAAFIQGLAP